MPNPLPTTLIIKGHRIAVVTNSRSRSIRARMLSDGSIRVTVPTQLSGSTIQTILPELVEKLLARAEKTAHPASPLYHHGKTIEMLGNHTITIEHNPNVTGAIKSISNTSAGNIVITCGRDIDFALHAGALSRVILRIAASFAPSVIIPQIQSKAQQLHLTPAGYGISRGIKTLGTCTHRGHISISAACMFLTPELLDYIICHELAHLTEMNHSPKFHTLCNSYLLGREASLRRILRQFQWPIVR